MTLVFATNNPNKIKEIRSVLTDEFTVITLEEAGINIEIPEPHQTLEENASEKSQTIATITGKHCFSEDTGLEVNALNGEPGVRSARYAGEHADSGENINKLLVKMKGKENRSAQFRTVISLILNNNEYFFEGICKGEISLKPKGNNGFGYDPIFKPADSNKTFAEMLIDEKNLFSHRKKAFDKLIGFLKNYNGTPQN